MGLRIGPNPPQFNPAERDKKSEGVESPAATRAGDTADGRRLSLVDPGVLDPGPAVLVDISEQGRALAAQQLELEGNLFRSANRLPSPE